MQQKQTALILGAGVIGLSSAIRLREAGWDVEIWAKSIPPETTSNVAAAIWYPYHAGPVEKVREWGLRTLQELLLLSQLPDSGVFLSRGRKVFHRPMGDPWWKDHVPEFRRLRDREMYGGESGGYEFQTPVACMDRYLDYLLNRFESSGGRIVLKYLSSLSELPIQSALVVNCTGLGARELFNDHELYPIRGEVVAIESLSQDDFFLDTDHPDGILYIIPREHDCILGGTSVKGEESLLPSVETATDFVNRCAGVRPEIKGKRWLSHRVGLRPGRHQICLERVETARGPVIHNYGHGGSGVTLSWGAADEVLALAERR